MTPLFLLAQAAALAQPQISHEAIGPGHYRLRIVVPGTSSEAVAQALLLPTARQLCAGRAINFGHFEWVGSQRVSDHARPQDDAVGMVQELFCGAAPPEPPNSVAPPNPDWRQNTAQEQAVRARTIAYFAAEDEGRLAAAYAMLTPSMQADSSQQDWSAQRAEFNRQAGAPRGRQLIRVTWYNNPPGAPVPGLYAAVDFNGDFAGLHFLCGYVVWVLQRDGSWGLVREEQNSASRASVPNATPAQLAQLRVQLGCRD